MCLYVSGLPAALRRGPNALSLSLSRTTRVLSKSYDLTRPLLFRASISLCLYVCLWSPCCPSQGTQGSLSLSHHQSPVQIERLEKASVISGPTTRHTYRPKHGGVRHLRAFEESSIGSTPCLSLTAQVTATRVPMHQMGWVTPITQPPCSRHVSLWLPKSPPHGCTHKKNLYVARHIRIA